MLEKKGEWKRKNAGRIVLAALVLLLLLIGLTALLGGRAKNADSTDKRLAFIASLGWEADAETEEARTVTIPRCDEGAMAEYNALMQKGGYDLSRYEGKTVEQYSYQLTNYPGTDQKVFITVYVWHGRVIGGDIHTAALNGFMHELRAAE